MSLLLDNTAAEKARPKDLQIAHVLFMDLVGYSRLPMDEQTGLLDDLQEMARGTADFRQAEDAGDLICLPTGDGMALVFSRDPVAPVRCAIEIARRVRRSPHVRLRMGIHSGAVYRVMDINARANVAGSGVNIAQRVMDCGDAGHILVSSSTADVLGQIGQWSACLHDLGHCEVKHGMRLHLFNLCTPEVGNPEVPERVRARPATGGILHELREKRDEHLAREIEIHYPLIMAGEGAHYVAQCLAASLAIQVDAGLRRSAATGALCFGAEALRRALAVFLEGRAAAGGAPAQPGVNEDADPAWGVAGIVNHYVTSTADRIQARQRNMESIAGAMRHGLPQHLQESLWRAEEALKSGMRAEGKPREALYQEAIRHLRRGLADRTGRRDHAAWFQMGWLYWKGVRRLQEGEEAFSQVVRLSSAARDAYYFEGLRHLAHVRYLRGNLGGAFRAIEEAMANSTEYEILYDASRYSVLIGRSADGIELLGQCVQRTPIALIAALAEGDFVPAQEEWQELVRQLLLRARHDAKGVTERWREALQAIESWEQDAGCPAALPPHLAAASAAMAAEDAESADYITAVSIDRHATRAAQDALEAARRSFEEELGRRSDEVSAVGQELEATKRQAGWVGSEALERKQAEADKAEREWRAIAGVPPALDEHARIGCAVMLASAAALAAMVFLGEGVSALRTPVGVGLAILTLGGWFILPTLRWLRYWGETAAARARAAAARRAVEDAFARVVAETDPEVAARIRTLEEAAAQAEKRRRSIQQVLARVRAVRPAR